jgi:ribosome-associated protein
MIRINRDVAIPESEIRFTFTRSPGPGGQNVNKVATTAVLSLDLAACAALSADQRARARRALGNRINKDGILAVVCRVHRTQAANRRAALRRFIELLAAALKPPVPRRPTNPTQASKERRLAAKTRLSCRKSDRRFRPEGE